MKYCTRVESTYVAMEDAQNSINFVINGGEGTEDVIVLRHSKGLCIVT